MSLLRPRQKLFVERSLAALKEYKNTLAVAPTGFGKSRALSAVVAETVRNNRKACVLAHRDELVLQNKQQFEQYVTNGDYRTNTSLVNAGEKSWDGDAVFAMVPTLAREKQLMAMPTLDLLVIDEAHHAAAPSYRRVIDQAKNQNPDICIFGVTASPARSDGKALNSVFTNVADQVRIGEVINAGHLVRPKTYVIDVGVQDDLMAVNKKGHDFDMDAVEAIMDHTIINDEVVSHWKEKAGHRKTIVFCSTVDHAFHACKAFKKQEIQAAVVHGDLEHTDRKKILTSFERGDLQVLLNCFVLTEGYDCPPVSCVVLLRPSSHKSTFIQCVGRGLRTVNPEEYPGVIKNDCIILDFGISSITHGKLEQEVNLEGCDGTGEAPKKECPSCASEVPLGVRECPLCGYVWEKEEKRPEGFLKDFVMTEIDLLNQSSFQWCDLFNDGSSMLATGFDAWGGAFFMDGSWYAVGGTRNKKARLISVGERTICLAAANDWLNEYETENGAKKSRGWLNQPATKQQLKYLKKHKNNFGLTRYHASCLLAFNFNKLDIQGVVFSAARQNAA